MRDGVEALCIDCYHCVAYCPTGAAGHVRCPSDRHVFVNPADCASAAQMRASMLLRRSGRCYRKERVPTDVILTILETARYAPTGSNRQDVRWILSQSVKTADAFRGLYRAYLDKLLADEARYPFAAPLARQIDAGEDPILRGSSQFVVTVQPCDTISKGDGRLALTYFELLAQSQGISTCWAGYATDAAQADGALRKLLGVRETEAVCGLQFFGYPIYNKTGRIPQRKPLDCTIIE